MSKQYDELSLWKELAEKRGDLLVCYRIGRRPGDRLLDRLKWLSLKISELEETDNG